MNFGLLPAADTFLDSLLPPGSAHASAAAVDCDGTVIRGDIGEAMLYDQLERGLFRTSPARIWSDHPQRDLLEHLHAQASRGADGAPHHARAREDLGKILLGTYTGLLAEGRTTRACADIVRLWAGYSEEDVRALAQDALRRAEAAPPGNTLFAGRAVARGVRFIQPVVDLVRAMLRRGYRVLAVSGSSQWSVEAVFARIGLPARDVAGIDLESSGGILSGLPRAPVPVGEGKVEVFRSRMGEDPLVVISDSIFDLPLFGRARRAKVLVSGDTAEAEAFFRSAGVIPDDTWHVCISPPELREEERACRM
ncbi:MAG: haloacid dehalogenase-like hydrolase [Bacteroidota bacterium]